MDTQALRSSDRQHIWHPFTQQQGWLSEDAPIIRSADGCTLTDTDDKTYIDGVSSLWCNVHGHRHPKIDAAVRDQLDRVAHSTMLGLSHEPAIELAERLIAIAPGDLTRVFYSDSGSTATEIALKIAFQHFKQSGQPQRKRFLTLTDAYHGDTIGAVSAGGMELFHAAYEPLLFDTVKVTAGDLNQLDAAFNEHGEELAAVLMEPLVQGAAGMIVHPAGYLTRVRELCDQHGVLLILDEVASGFGRTGKMFACEHEDVAPDMLCVAKGISGGYLPLAATFTTEAIYRSFLGEHHEYKTFFHGHTYTGNPLACAAAIASLDVFEEERTLDHVAGLEAVLATGLAEIAKQDRVAEIRRVGTMVGIELGGFPIEARVGHRITLAARERGAIIRPLGDTVVLMPPLAISTAQLEELLRITAESIAAVVTESAAGNEPTVERERVSI
jgi:adenosylmethionine-8-amino-7-oxononanoate aminotransferase